jgi:YidC/Oxa1 family membrane protein insertase
MTDNKNTIIAIVLSAIVLLGWQYFVGMPQMERQRQEALLKQQQQTTTAPAPGAQPGQPGTPAPGAQPGQPGAPAPGSNVPVPGQPGAPPAPGGLTVPGTATPAQVQTQTRAAVIASSPRIQVETPRVKGTIALKGARLDDLALIQYRETVDPKSPPIVLLSPSGAEHPFYAEFGWVRGAGVNAKLPDADTVWTQEGAGALTPGKPVTLTWDNGEGLTFRRTIAVDDKYLFTARDEVTNKAADPVTLFPYALISRHGTPKTEGYYILHEGFIGVLGEQGLKEESYKSVEDKKAITFTATNAWLGITDKYWAATLLPDTTKKLNARFSAGAAGTTKTYQTDYLLDPITIAPGASGAADMRLFAGAKEVQTIDAYDKALGLNRFELLIDWGWFYFITKPMFKAIDFFFHLVGNFGLAILIVTVLVKLLFFPLANKSYASMAKMKAVQPEMMAIRERYGDDKMKQQQALMELYKKEKINPLAGCLPIVVQIPVFFALYKVLFVTIEMRHAPFYGWIRDLSAPDPSNIFNLFGLIPYDPTLIPMLGQFLHLGFWPIVMGLTMFVQMKLNPAPPDPTQKMIFDWMPLIFTFMLAGFSAGLVIYWAWNNTLSVTQQAFIMNKHGAKIELWDNLRDLWARMTGAGKKDPGKVVDKSKTKA